MQAAGSTQAASAPETSPVLRLPPAAGERHAGWRLVFDLGVLFFLFATIIGSVLLVIPLVLFVILPILLFARTRAGAGWRATDWLAISAALIYPVYSLGMLYLYPGDVVSERREYFEAYYLQLYLFAILCFALGYLRGLQMPNFFALYRVAAPWFIFLSFAAFTALSLYKGDICYADAWTGIVIIPAITFTTLVFLALVGWCEFSRTERLLRMLGLMLAILVVVAYSGRRGIFVAIMAVVVVLLALNLLRGFRGKIPGALLLIGGCVGGLAMSAVFQWSTGCNVFGHLETIIRPITLSFQQNLLVAPAFASEGTGALASSTIDEIISAARDLSIAYRLQFYLIAAEAIASSPIHGLGLLNQLDLLSAFNETHVHNQFLTWLVTGGAVRLLIGCLYLAAPLVIARKWPVSDRIILTLALTGLWGVSLATDAFLEWHFFIQFYAFIIGCTAGVSAARKRCIQGG